jgi:hypothetical protein
MAKIRFVRCSVVRKCLCLQESSSEAVNGYYAMMLYGEALASNPSTLPAETVVALPWDLVYYRSV